MIAVQKVVSQLESALDAEGFGRYDFDRDFIPAINYAKDFILSVYNKVMSDNKLSEESVREVSYTKVWLTSQFSRVSMSISDIGGQVWTVKGVFPEPEIIGVPTPLSNANESELMGSVTYLKSYKSAKRVSVETANINRKNPFAQGNELEECSDLKEYAYIVFSDYKGLPNYSPQERWEIQILPDYKQKLVGINYLLYPQDIEVIGDIIPFPDSLTNAIVTKALNFISVKQGDNTNLYGVTEKEISTVMQLLT
jgi:hypothetical protein